MWFVMGRYTDSANKESTMWVYLIEHSGPTQEMFEKQKCLIPKGRTGQLCNTF